MKLRAGSGVPRAGSCKLQGIQAKSCALSRWEVARATWAGRAPCPPLGAPGLDRAGTPGADERSGVPGLGERVAEGGTVLAPPLFVVS